MPGASLAQDGSGPNSAPRVGLLLPLSGVNAGLGHAMLQAAQLAVSLPGAPPVTLDPQDTAGTASGAANAARQAIASGDGMLIGPLTAPETAAAAPAATAASVPMLAFTSDTSQARPGIWTLGITPGQQVRRLVAAAQSENRMRFAAVLPDNPLGQAMGDAMRRAAPDADLRSYPAGNTSALQTALADISRYGDRHPRAAPPAVAPPGAAAPGAATPGAVTPGTAAPAVAAPGAAPIGFFGPASMGARLFDVAVRFRGLNPNGDVAPGDSGNAPPAGAGKARPGCARPVSLGPIGNRAGGDTASRRAGRGPGGAGRAAALRCAARGRGRQPRPGARGPARAR